MTGAFLLCAIFEVRGFGERWRRLAVFPKVDGPSGRGLMAPPGLRPWAPRVLSGIGFAFRTGSPGSALGSYIVPLCAYPAWDTQVSRSWPLACPIRGLPFSRLTDWRGGRLASPFCMPPVGGENLYNRASPDGNAPLFPLRGTSPGGGSLLYAFLRSYVAHCIVSIVPHNSTRKRRADLPLRGRCRRQKGCISTSVARFACFPFAPKARLFGLIIRGGLHHFMAAHHRRLLVFTGVCLMGCLYRDSSLRSE